jgi:hypothetical protein
MGELICAAWLFSNMFSKTLSNGSLVPRLILIMRRFEVGGH